MKNKILLTCLCLIAFLSLLQLKAQNVPNSNWTKIISETHPYDGYTWEDINPEMIITGDTVHFLWVSVRSGRGIIYYRNSTDKGLTLNPARVIVDTTGNINTFSGMSNFNLRRMAVAGSKIHITYNIRSNIFYVKSADNGLNFSEPKVLCSMESTTNRALSDPYISAFKDQVVVAFVQDSASSYMGDHESNTMMTVTSTDGGDNFSFARATPRFDYANLIDVVQTPNKIHLLFLLDDDVQRLGLATSENHGISYSFQWISDTTMTSENWLECEYFKGYQPKISVTGDSLFVVWRSIDKDTIPKIFIAKSFDDGNTFSSPFLLVDQSSPFYEDIDASTLTVAAKGKIVLVSFADDNDLVYLVRSEDGGNSFSKPIQMHSEGRPFLYYQNGLLHPKIQFCTSDNAGEKVYLGFNNAKIRASEDGFATFSSLRIYDLYYTGGYRNRMQLAVDDDDAAHMVYEYTLTKNTSEHGYIYYRIAAAEAPPASNENMSISMECVDSIGRYDMMEIPSSAALSFDRKLTIELWVKPKPGSDNDQCFVLKQSADSLGSGSFYNGYGLYTTNSSYGRKLYGMIYTTDDVYKVYDNDTLTSGAWNHIAMVYDADGGVNNFKLYLNGSGIDSTTVVGAINPYQFESPVWIGGIAYSQFYPFSGEIDELRFWNKALTLNELKAGMHQQLTGNEEGLVAYYNFNQTTRDMTGNGQDGILLYKESYVLSTPLGLQNPDVDRADATMLRIYPNPFSQSATIRYSLPEDAGVIVQIYNAIGQLVAQPENSWQPAGQHEFTFPAANLPGGIYFCKMITERGEIKTENSSKMILIR